MLSSYLWGDQQGDGQAVVRAPLTTSVCSGHCHRTGWLKDGHFFLTVLEVGKFNIKVPADAVPGESSPPGFQMGLLHSTERHSPFPPVSPHMALIPPWRFHTHVSPKAAPQMLPHWVLTYIFWGGHNLLHSSTLPLGTTKTFNKLRHKHLPSVMAARTASALSSTKEVSMLVMDAGDTVTQEPSPKRSCSTPGPPPPASVSQATFAQTGQQQNQVSQRRRWDSPSGFAPREMGFTLWGSASGVNSAAQVNCEEAC